MNATPAPGQGDRGTPLFSPDWPELPRGVRAGVSTREGGVSSGTFASLNVSFTTGDDAARVVENRRLLASAAGYDARRAVLPVLEHGVTTLDVGPEHAGLGALAPGPPLRGDALVSTQPDLPLLATSADCAPVFLADVEGRAIGIVHAGWRGAADGIAARATRRLAELLPSGARIVAAFGPCIGPCCFEVGEDVAARFEEHADSVVRSARLRDDGQQRPGARPRVDLFAALRAQLRHAGAEVGDVRPPCTACDDRRRFFSHRAMGGTPTGRMAAYILRSCSP